MAAASMKKQQSPNTATPGGRTQKFSMISNSTQLTEISILCNSEDQNPILDRSFSSKRKKSFVRKMQPLKEDDHKEINTIENEKVKFTVTTAMTILVSDF